ncbi:Protein BATH-7 [Aphelenchoides avenae]|nr:Protein BATH-7 [Aphelenchus avenae]
MDVSQLVTIDRDGWVFEVHSDCSWTARNDPICFVIRVLGVSGSSSNLEANVVLEVEDREFPANISHLSSLSPVFKETLNLEFPEGEPRKVKLDGVSANDFQQFMAAISGTGTLSAQNVNGIRELADRFDVPELLKRCSDFVCRVEDMPLLEKFQLAENWQDNQLMTSLTALVGTGKCFTGLLQAGIRTTLASETQDLIFKKAETLH